jgi:hypothetical protein
VAKANAMITAENLPYERRLKLKVNAIVPRKSAIVTNRDPINFAESPIFILSVGTWAIFRAPVIGQTTRTWLRKV